MHVQRVVLTSSFAAIGYGHAQCSAPFNKHDWSDTTQPITAYVESKTLAERAAWELMAREGGAMELSVITPVGALGPVLGADYSAAIQLFKQLLSGAVPACLQLYFDVVDVRDVTDLHAMAMTHIAAAGERLLAVADNFLSVREVARVLRNRMGVAAKRVPTREIPNWVVRGAALFSALARDAVPELGKAKNATSEKARRELGWMSRSSEAAIVATAESILRGSEVDERVPIHRSATAAESLATVRNRRSMADQGHLVQSKVIMDSSPVREVVSNVSP